MKRELKTRRKDLRVTPKTFEDAQEIKDAMEVSDSDIYSTGLRVMKTIIRTTELDSTILHNMFRFGKGAKDDLVSEEYQGNVEQMTPSKRARLFFSISESEWDLLSEVEKLDYIERMTAIKKRAGGGEMSNRDNTFANRNMNSTVARDFFIGEMKAITDRLERKNRKYIDDRRG